MPIPVSVTGFTRKAGALSHESGAVNMEHVPAGKLNLFDEPVLLPKAAAPAPAATAPAPEADVPTAKDLPLVKTDHLNFCYPALDGRPIPGIPPMITDMCMEMYPGQCGLLLGANGAGKTTLLKILGGYHMIPKEMVTVLGEPPFHTTHLTMSGALAFIGGSWTREVAFAGNSIPLSGDFPAGKMIENIRNVDPARRKEIMEVLEINPDWKMNHVSDGQRRRVQLCIGLLKPYKVLLLDEITVDLDVLGRADLLDYLKKDAKERGACILYATHIFDGLEDWLDSIAFVSRGKLQFHKKKEEMPEVQKDGLLLTVAGWLREEKAKFDAMQETKKSDPTAKPDGYYARNNGYSSGTLASTLAGSSNMVW
eukprot:CAMPEP_0118925704 /NCGR_PEP_ID=MMETSP1169-20130426/3548_1 /TAXON_ID=36882 /ORGANISM="Pyramimonas obovata, Strain CCMP722" /LENGTH=366 /DNA_ID=CAMNT_0006867077 /DNA_START=139 /DNA_END=1236 /DNA_ORIENTATION=+